jgi:hypothetical protein
MIRLISVWSFASLGVRECTALKFSREAIQTDPAFPDEGPASRLTKLSVNFSGEFSLDIVGVRW